MRLTVAVPYFAISASNPSTTAGCALSASMRTASVVEAEAIGVRSGKGTRSVLPAASAPPSFELRARGEREPAAPHVRRDDQAESPTRLATCAQIALIAAMSAGFTR